MSSSAERASARLAALAAITAEPGRMTRLAFSPEMRRANALVADWFRDAGADRVREDAAGNLMAGRGRCGPRSGTTSPPPIATCPRPAA